MSEKMDITIDYAAYSTYNAFPLPDGLPLKLRRLQKAKEILDAQVKVTSETSPYNNRHFLFHSGILTLCIREIMKGF